MIDIFNVHHAAKIGWIRRLCENNNEKWKLIMLKRMGITENQLNKKLDQSIINKTTKFYKQVLTSWSLLYYHQQNSQAEILARNPS